MSNEKIYLHPDYPYRKPRPRIEYRSKQRDMKKIIRLVGLGILDAGYLIYSLVMAQQFARLDTGIIFLALIMHGILSCCVGYWNFLILARSSRSR